ncbi:MAG: EFR1 family ferrodoxin [Parasporobacterium sp.]|nr:EFR1 family ferrodoxin [Parasporobacterium sp.]
MIFYFTGTGNSRYTARRIAEISGRELIDINEKIKRQDTGSIDAGAEVVFVVPTYAWRIPKVVEQWIRDTHFTGAAKAWFVMTCGDEIGNAAGYNRKLCEEKHWEYMGTAQIVMPENYIAMFAVPKPSTARKIIQNAQPRIETAAEAIAAGRMLPEEKATSIDRIKSRMINPVFYSLFVKADAFRATDQCVGCGKCGELCPLNNIKTEGGRPVWQNRCTHCMACICCCPVEAVEYGRKSVGKPRYYLDV